MLACAGIQLTVSRSVYTATAGCCSAPQDGNGILVITVISKYLFTLASRLWGPVDRRRRSGPTPCTPGRPWEEKRFGRPREEIWEGAPDWGRHEQRGWRWVGLGEDEDEAGELGFLRGSIPIHRMGFLRGSKRDWFAARSRVNPLQMLFSFVSPYKWEVNSSSFFPHSSY